MPIMTSFWDMLCSLYNNLSLSQVRLYQTLIIISFPHTIILLVIFNREMTLIYYDFMNNISPRQPHRQTCVTIVYCCYCYYLFVTIHHLWCFMAFLCFLAASISRLHLKTCWLTGYLKKREIINFYKKLGNTVKANRHNKYLVVNKGY